VTPTPIRLPTSRHLEELNVLEQIHTALGSASKLDDFYVIVASLLLGPNTFGFTRAFIIRYDERIRTFSGRLALGANSPEEHRVMRADMLEEDRRLQELVEELQQQNPEPGAVQRLYDLRYHSMWIQYLQGEGQEQGAGLHAQFSELQWKRDALPNDHVLEQAAGSHQAILFSPKDVNLEGLESIFTEPFIAGRLITKRGLHAVILADKKFEPGPVHDESVVYFQWLLNHASVTLDNVELVTELTQTTERLREVDRLKTNFLSIVSHELRTPLTSIIGFIHLLSEGKVGQLVPAQLDLLKRVSQHSNHLQSMVNDLLEIAEVEAGGMVNVQLRPVDPLSAVLKVATKAETRRSNNMVKVEPIIRDRVPLILSDDSALERILYHLLDNAIKFSGKPGRVTVEFNKQGSDLDIVVADNGIGIQEENLQKIFEQFYQVDFRLERVYGGMGIGLSVVKILLDATGGRIRVDSRPGEGSRFTLTYPVAST
jgi:signal transduction histidine kinase